jgi:predicted DCC family thiol-disulfide oxidoreductase YuxK
MILLYDGVCGLCNFWVQFALERDPNGRFRFAPLQGSTAARILARHGKDPAALDTVYLVLDPDAPAERLLTKGRAIGRVLHELGGLWTIPGLLRFLPDFLLDLGYDFVARNRYRWFGRHDSCPIPTPAQRARFLE